MFFAAHQTRAIAHSSAAPSPPPPLPPAGEGSCSGQRFRLCQGGIVDTVYPVKRHVMSDRMVFLIS